MHMITYCNIICYNKKIELNVLSAGYQLKQLFTTYTMKLYAIKNNDSILTLIGSNLYIFELKKARN